MKSSFDVQKETVLGRDQRFFTVVLSKMYLGNVKNVIFCLNNPEICDETYR